MIYLKLIFTTFLFFSFAQANTVNLTTGHFYKKTSVLSFNGLNTNIWKSYNSGDRFKGLFGKGWCSNLDYKVKRTKGRVTIWHCGKEWVTLEKKSNFYQSGNYILSEKKDRYSLFEKKLKIFDFNKRGKLLSIGFGIDSLYIVYRNNKIIVKNGYKKKFAFNLKNKKVTSLTYENKIIHKFKYKKDILIAEWNYQNQKTSYNFSSKERLNKITYPDGKYLKLKYSPKGIVLSANKSGKCVEKFNYRKYGSSPLKLMSENKCKNSTPTKTVHQLKVTPRGQIKEYFSPQVHKKITYDPRTKNITKYVNKSEQKQYKYNKKNQLVEFDYKSYLKDFKSKISYNKKGRIQRVSYRNHSDTKSLRVVNLKYHKSGKIRLVRTSDGNAFNIKYLGPYLRKISSKVGQLNYNYGANRTLSSVSLKTKGKVFKHKIGKKNSAKPANAIANFLASFYKSMGPLYKHSYVLREVIE